MPILKTSHKNYGSDSLVNLVLFLCYGLLNNKEIQIIVLIFRDSKLLLLFCIKKFHFCGLLRIYELLPYFWSPTGCLTLKCAIVNGSEGLKDQWFCWCLGAMGIWLLTFIFHTSAKGWPPQPLKEKGPNIIEKLDF